MTSNPGPLRRGGTVYIAAAICVLLRDDRQTVLAALAKSHLTDGGQIDPDDLAKRLSTADPAFPAEFSDMVNTAVAILEATGRHRFS